jgi:hypothetical protein
MRVVSRAVLLAGFFAVLSTATFAGGLNPFGPSGMPLTQGDYSAMAAAAKPLLDDDTLPIGTTHDWNNAKSGNKGTIKLLDRFEYEYEGAKLPCRKLQYHVEVKTWADPYNLDLNRCKVADGSWKIL